MKRITIYRHPDCAKCRRYAKVHRLMDWLGRVETSTETPKIGALRMGEIAVEDHRTGEVGRGVEAVRSICRQIPAYAVFLPLLRIPAIARAAERDVGGCGGDACGVESSEGRGAAS